MAPSLVAAYASDSDDDEPRSAAAGPPQKVSEEEEPTEAPEPPTSTRPSGLSLPPPKSRAPAKRQIHVDLEPAAPADEAQDVPRRPKMQAREGGHGLFSMLPAPQSNKPIAKPKHDDARPENHVDDDTRLTIVDKDTSGKAKGNDDFRAMLGLAPKASRPERPKPVIVSESAPAGRAQEIPNDTPTETGAGASTSRGHADDSSSHLASKYRISAAPDVEAKAPDADPAPEPEVDLAAMYPGWRCDPDGSWYPVTPEAHAAYAAWAAQAEAEARAQAAFRSKSDTLPDPAQISSFDAGQELRSARAEQPAPPVNKKPKVEWNISEKLQSERLTNMRARNRGQLSSLLVQAAESGDRLEERWAQGKTKRREASKRYGF